MKALIVEDDLLNREAMAELLLAEGWQVQTAVDGEQALARVEADCPDVILLDLILPVMDGWQFLKWLRAEKRFSETPVVIVTTASVASGPSVVPSSWISGVLSKPFDPVQAIALIRSMCATHGIEAASGGAP